MKSVKIALFFSIFSYFAISLSYAKVNPKAAPMRDPQRSGTYSPKTYTPPHSPMTPITLPGTRPIGLEGNYQGQFANRGLHNIIIDPAHPGNIHAAVTFAKDVTEADTVGGKGFLPQLRVYYTFSSDDGNTWSVPKPIDTGRTQFPEMILIKRGTEWVPVIAAERDYADTTTPYFCSLYIEQGTSGEGNFAEFRTDRKTFRDSLRNISYPSIAASHDGTKIFMSAGIIRSTDTYSYIQFGTFTLSEDKKTAVWGGWKTGPSAGTFKNENSVGDAYPWSTSLRVSESGKIGISWINNDFGTPDISTYLSESTDEGATWLATPKTILAPVETSQANYYFVAFNTDFWYAGDVAHCVLGGFYYNRDSAAGFYIPQSGSLLYWNDKMTIPVLVLSKETDMFPLGASTIDGSWLTGWQNAAGGTDPQGLTNLYYPTVARTTDPNVFSIYFSAWQDGDIQDMSEIGIIGDGKFLSYPYFGVWRIKTFDGGVTFSEPDRIRGNDLANPDDPKFDFRMVQTAPWNPGTSKNMTTHILYNVDTLAGIIDFNGNPGFDEVTWLFEKSDLAGVHQISDIILNALANYPNPFASHTMIPLVLENPEQVTLDVNDVLGRNVMHTKYGLLEGGKNEINFNAVSLPPGSYPYILTIGAKKIGGVLTVVK